MSTILDELYSTLWSTLRDVFPIATILLVFQFAVLRKRVHHPGRVLLGAVYVVLGLGLFLAGLEKALFPLGRLMAEQLTDPSFLTGIASATVEPLHWHDYYWVYLFALTIGFATAIAEPALIAVAITDVLPTGLSAVYTFFDPEERQRSLGTFAILHQIEYARALGLPHVYLGYWIQESPQMAYKSQFRPAQVWSAGDWQALGTL